MKNIVVYTGSRANYSSTKTVLKAFKESPSISAINLLGGAANTDRYGSLGNLMQADSVGKPDFYYTALHDVTSQDTMPMSLAAGISECTRVFSNGKPDAVLVVGDRYDILAPVIASTLLNIPVIHTMGGEVSGTIDENIRHAVTKMANLHFVSNDDAFHRVIRLGEDPNTVFNVGCPRMDLIAEVQQKYSPNMSVETILSRYKGVGSAKINDSDEYLLVSLHSVTTDEKETLDLITNLLRAIKYINKKVILIWPNFDSGTEIIAKRIRTFRETELTRDWLNCYTNFSVEDYTTLMLKSKMLIGNSSSGIREAAFLGVPVVNIGSRQNGRLTGKNVIHSTASYCEMIKAINQQMNSCYRSEKIYGDGNAGKKIVSIIENFEFSGSQKKICY